jgi:UDP-GlcNAc3NAcA epimerase
VGARPQFIKYLAISRSVKGPVKNILVHTGQHYDYVMSRIFFDQLKIDKPDYNLEVGPGSCGQQISTIIRRLEPVFKKENPDVVLTYGDTNSTLGGALAARGLNIPVAHVEAGLRSYNKDMPEEINRILTDHISAVLFCPSTNAVSNLKKEGFDNIACAGRLIPQGFKTGISAGKDNPLVVNVGDIMYDSLLYSLDIAKRSPTLRRMGLRPKGYYLFTMHRCGNTDSAENFGRIVGFINRVSREKTVIFPMHPRTRKYYKDIKNKFCNNVIIIEPVGYMDMLALLYNSRLLLTDSGGVQKEAYWLGIPCVTLRDETEWQETIDAGYNVLYKDYKGLWTPWKAKAAVYGDGKASERILDIITRVFGGG